MSMATRDSVKFSALGHTVHDPLLPTLTEEVLENLTSPLLPLWKFCISRSVTELTELKEAPQEVQELLKDPKHIAEILKYIHGRRQDSVQADPGQFRIWADEKERKEIAICHPVSV